MEKSKLFIRNQGDGEIIIAKQTFSTNMEKMLG